MKHILFAIAIFFFAGTVGCKKSSPANNGPSSITGKWNYTAYYFGTGGPVEWQQVTTANQWILLNTNGESGSNFSPFNAFISFQVTDSVHIKFTAPGVQGSAYYFFTFDSVKNELLLTPAQAGCIEGCAQKFTR